MKTVKFYTLGCKVNQFDTQSIRERFLEGGFREAGNKERPDLCVINTCTVTAIADQKSRYLIRRCAGIRPVAKVMVTGCLVENNAPSLCDIKGINYIISKRFFSEGISDFCGHTRAFLKIQDGCDNFCSYCKVPLVRGRSRSRPLDLIIKEALELAEKGFKEIVLTGICLGAYGKDFSQKFSLLEAIEELEKIDGLLRIRLSSIEAGDITGALIQKMAKSHKLCRHLHIPIQSGDDAILKKMHRRYTRKDYINLIERIRRYIPEIAITTDVLIGFPGEGEANFKNTLDLIKQIRPLKVHIFPYSMRPGTVAAGLKDAISPLEIKERILRLERVAESAAREYKRKFINKNMPVLIEGRLREDASYWQGLTNNYLKVTIKSDKDLQNKLISLVVKKL